MSGAGVCHSFTHPCGTALAHLWEHRPALCVLFFFSFFWLALFLRRVDGVIEKSAKRCTGLLFFSSFKCNLYCAVLGMGFYHY